MNDTLEAAPPEKPYSHRKGRRNGSETRERSALINFRATAAERAQIEAAAAQARLSIGSYIRSVAVAKPQMRARRGVGIEVEKLASLFGQLGKIGSNMNQIARALNRGKDDEWIPDALRQSLDELDALRRAIMQVMGRGER